MLKKYFTCKYCLKCKEYVSLDHCYDCHVLKEQIFKDFELTKVIIEDYTKLQLVDANKLPMWD